MVGIRSVWPLDHCPPTQARVSVQVSGLWVPGSGDTIYISPGRCDKIIKAAEKVLGKNHGQRYYAYELNANRDLSSTTPRPATARLQHRVLFDSSNGSLVHGAPRHVSSGRSVQTLWSGGRLARCPACAQGPQDRRSPAADTGHCRTRYRHVVTNRKFGACDIGVYDASPQTWDSMR